MANDLFSAPPGGGGPSMASAASRQPGADEEDRVRSLWRSSAATASNRSKTLPASVSSAPEFSFLSGAPAVGSLSPGASQATAAGSSPSAVDAATDSPFYFVREALSRTRLAAPAEGNFYEGWPARNVAPARRAFDVYAVRRDFPILEERVNGGKPLVWLDNAATTQKPLAVIERLAHFYRHENSNVHRAAHELAARSTDAYEAARQSVARFLNAPSSKEIVFVRGATEAINLVAQAWGRQNVGSKDKILITHLEHHANIVPWQRLCHETGCKLLVAPVDDRGEIILEEYQRLLWQQPRLVAFSQVSNALGTITPAKAMIEMAHRAGAITLLDGAQSVAHMRQDMAALDTDFFVFSGHKVFAPTGIGVLYGKADLLDAMSPWQGGGNMIDDVAFEQSTYQSAPQRFEAGTGSIGDAVALGAAVGYLEALGIDNITRYEQELLEYATACLGRVNGLRLIGTAPEKAGVLSFVIDGMRNEDIGSALSQRGIAVRAGHHCAQPILRRFGVESTVRPSLALYNTREEIDILTAALMRLRVGHGAGRV
jgi:cysteine desulfurase/selenocysteine lyase